MPNSPATNVTCHTTNEEKGYEKSKGRDIMSNGEWSVTNYIQVLL